MVQEDLLDGGSVGGTGEALDKPVEGSVSGGKEGQGRVTTESIDETRALDEGEQGVESEVLEAIRKVAGTSGPPLNSCLLSVVVAVATSGAPLAVAASAAGPGRHHGDADKEDGHLELHGCEVNLRR